MPKISVIVPLYNAEKYLSRCIDSVLAQTFTDFELILINDGSTDTSGKICDNYAQKDSRVKVVHKENGGVSSARNIGLDIAVGEWITFVDSDDSILTEMLERLNIGGEDLKVCGYYDQIENDMPHEAIYNSVEECANYINKEFRHNYINAPWAKLFNASIIRNYNLRFDETLSLGEDSEFVFHYCCYCKSIKTFREALYNYKRPNSLASKYVFTAQNMSNFLFKLHKTIYTLESSHKNEYKSIHIWLNDISFKRFMIYLNTCNKKQFCQEMSYFKKHCFKYHPKMNYKELVYLWLQMNFPSMFYNRR